MKKISVLLILVFLLTLSSSVFANNGTIRNSSFVILRSGPDVNAEAVAVLPFSEEISVIKVTGDWAQVSCSKGSGFMRRHYLKWNGSTITPSVPANTTVNPQTPSAINASTGNASQVERPVTVNSNEMRSITHNETVYLRLEKSLNSNSPTALTPGTPVKVLGVENGWCKVEVNGQIGYVRSFYLGLSDNASMTRISENQNTEVSISPVQPPEMLPPPDLTPVVTPPVVNNNPKPPVVDNTPKPTPSNNEPVDNSWTTSFSKTNVISNREFTDHNTMTKNEIQNFLAKKGSVLSKPYKGIIPSEAIYNAAQKYKINPKLILTRLQVEQGLVSKKTATEHKLDWALGCGAYDGGNWNENFRGFDKQVDGCAKTFRRWYDDGKNKGDKMTMKIDGKTLTTNNSATYSLYKYTPHIAGTNLHWKVYKGFWKI